MFRNAGPSFAHTKSFFGNWRQKQQMKELAGLSSGKHISGNLSRETFTLEDV